MIAATQGDLVSARSEEFLFAPDRDLVRLRHLLKSAFVQQLRGARAAVPDGALAYPC